MLKSAARGSETWEITQAKVGVRGAVIRIEASEVKTALHDETTVEPAANEFTGRVVSVTDGDTIDVLLDDKTTVCARFNGIDAPERGQPFGNNAKEFVSNAFHASPDVRIVELGITLSIPTTRSLPRQSDPPGKRNADSG